jgi:hypothetical protein
MRMTMRVSLLNPITYYGRRYEAIEIGPTTVAAVEASEAVKQAGANNLDVFIAMVSFDTGWPPEVFRLIKMTDFNRICAAFEAANSLDLETSGEASGTTLSQSEPIKDLQDGSKLPGYKLN